MKTNQWIKSERYPIFYMTDGDSIFGNMELKDGSMEDNIFEVDYYAFSEERLTPQELTEQEQFKEEMIKLFGEDAVNLCPIKFFTNQPQNA